MINLIPPSVILTRLQKRLMIQGAIVTALLIFFATFLIVPRYFENKNLQGYISQLSDKNLTIQETLATTQDFGEKLHEILETLKYYKSMIPPQKMVSEVLNDIGSRAQKNRLSVVSLQAVDEHPFRAGKGKSIVEVKGREIVEVVIEMSARGSFSDVGRYISNLEKAPYAILIKDISLNREGNAKGAIRSQIKLKADIKFVVLMKKSVLGIKEK
jgi:hypothetical protein